MARDVQPILWYWAGNAAKIKKAKSGCPLVIVRRRVDDIAGNPFLDLMCSHLIGLQKLTIKTQTFKYQGTPAQYSERKTSVPYSPQLHALPSATLPCAKLCGVGGVGAASTTKTKTTITNTSMAFYVDLVAIGFEERFEGSLMTKNAFGEPFESFDVLLSTIKVHCTTWEQNTTWNDVNNFGVDNELLISRTHDSEIATWPGQRCYEPLLNLDTAGQAATVDSSHSRYIRSPWVSGRIVDGKFLRGKWLPPATCNNPSPSDQQISQRQVHGSSND